MTYHDYVIKNGQFVGRFDEMYKDCEDPWHQSSPESNLLSKPKNIAILNMRKYGVRSVLEIGSGLGFYSGMIEAAGIKVRGLEISETAVTKAKEQFPNIDFRVGTVTDLAKHAEFDAILFAEVTWYILADLAKAYSQMLDTFSGKYFIHNLTFYKGDRQKFGREYFSTFEQFVEHCPFKLIEYSLSQTTAPDSVIASSAIFKVEKK